MESDMELVIASKDVSSWSLRPWLLLKQAGIPFKETLIPLYQPRTKERILAYSASGKLPLLIHNELSIWDSLAIAEYIAESFPDKQLWPEDRRDRAYARSLSAEMHSSFTSLRTHLSMNVLETFPRPDLNHETETDIRRIETIWRDSLKRSGGPYLFGKRFTIADAMYAPVVTRFRSYSIELTGEAKDYADRIFALPHLQEWIASAKRDRAELMKSV